MPRSVSLSAIALVALAGLGACTQDFDQFDPIRSGGTGGLGGAGGASSSATSTSSASSSTTTSSGGGGGSVEDCLNGQDDDDNGATDCADAACSGFACLDVPDDWEGPGILYEGPPDPMPDCPDDFPTSIDVGGTDIINDPATCSACTCGAPAITCRPSALLAFRSDNCGSFGFPNAQPSSGDCSTLTAGTTIRSYIANPPAADAEDCAPSETSLMGSPPSFGAQGRVCALRAGSGGCASGESCSPTQIAPPFVGASCIWRDGEEDCPSGFEQRHVFATGLVDNRSCSPCACGTPNVSCEATTTIYGDALCSDAVEIVSNNAMCAVNAPPGVALTVEITSAGSCAASGGEPSGSVDLDGDVTTVCCRP